MAIAPIPSTPRVISPSPTPSDASKQGSGKDGYFGPVTRSMRGSRFKSPSTIDEDSPDSDHDPEKRARTRSRSPKLKGSRGRISGMTPLNSEQGAKQRSKNVDPLHLAPNGTVNGHLSPESANKRYWREVSRSPSPLGLIPIHQKWRTFIHKHEIPRKFLHVSIGFVTLYLYVTGVQTSSIHPVLLALLIPIALTDYIRHNNPSVNRFYIRCLGALMRESEVDGWNGTISYLLGAYLVLLLLPKDIGVMSILLLSWCDTAASTFGRLWGKYTPQVRRGKSLAGSIAAFIAGIGTAAIFWGVIAPRTPAEWDSGKFAFAFQGALGLPEQVRALVGWSDGQASISGGLALGVVSIWAGLVGSVSEAIDLWGWDDNVTIPILCGAGLWGFLKAFGQA